MDSFEFESGKVLKDVNVEYVTFGTPKYGEEGQLSNVILYNHGSMGNFSSMKKIFPLSYENGPFDENKFFFISISALGSPGSCSPSTTDLKNKFPSYSVRDIVNFQKQFLKEKFNISHILGIIGNSMGGFVALTQAIEYPDFSDHFQRRKILLPISDDHNYLKNPVFVQEPFSFSVMTRK